MTPLRKRITFLLSVAVLLVFSILTIDGNFVRQRVQIDPRRAIEAASNDASWQEVAINASDRVPLKGWLFTPGTANQRAVMFVHGRGGTRHQMLARAESVADAEDVGGEQAVGAGVPVGGVAGRVLALVLEWTALHRVTVRMNWENARLGVPPPPSPR